MKPCHRVVVGLVLLGVVAGPLPAQSFSRDVSATAAMVGFGASVVVAGDEIFIGRLGESLFFPMPATQQGGVHVFGRAADGWVEQTTVASDDVGYGDGFAQALAVAGNVLLVGAPKQGGGRGAVYVFERPASGAEWVPRGQLVPSDGGTGDSLGFALAVHEAVALVGAPGHDSSRGAAYVFRRNAATGAWTQAGKLAPESRVAGDRFGTSVAVDRERAAVGAPGAHPVPPVIGAPPTLKPGAAFLFRRDGETWRQEAQLTAADSLARSLGTTVSLAWTGVLVGAPGSAGMSGAVFHFTHDESMGWHESAKLVPTGGQPPFPLFGTAIAKAGADILIGAPGDAGLTGVVYVFRQDQAGTWAQAQRVTTRGLTIAAWFGGAIAAQDDMAVVGSPGAAFFEGTGYLYARDAASGEWREAGTVIDATGGLEPMVGGETSCEGGTAGAFDCTDVDLVSFLPVAALGGDRGIQVNDLWGWTDPDTGREYAIVGRFDGTTFVDVTDAANPVYLGELPLTEGATPNLWRDMKVHANHVFIVADNAGAHGVQIFDLTQLRDVANPPATFTETAHYDRINSAHNVVANPETGFVYVVGASGGGETCGGGLHMIDVRDPATPTFAGCFSDPSTGNAGTGYSHDAMCVVYQGPDAAYRGHEICIGSNETAISIADVTDRANPVAVSSASYPNVVYAHQGWISDDHRYFFSNDEGDEIAGVTPRTRTLVWDIVDLDDPVLLTQYMGETAATDHNLYVHRNLMYESNYVAGLRIIDVSDPANPREVGHFDTVPWGVNSPGFAGAWSNYPFFESGNIVVTSMREGMFVLRHRPQHPVP
jgi:choice-of-anchor B domain-containing protein